MTELNNKNIIIKILSKFPVILLFISVLNDYDFNYLNLKYFSFNFSYILIFYYSLKKSESLGYSYIFIAGLFKAGIPIGKINIDTSSTDRRIEFFTDFSQLKFIKVFSFIKSEVK